MAHSRKWLLGFIVVAGALGAGVPANAQFIGTSGQFAPNTYGVNQGFGYRYGYGNAYGYNPYQNRGYVNPGMYYANRPLTYNNLNGVGAMINQSIVNKGTASSGRRRR